MKLDLDFLRKMLLTIDAWESFKPMENADFINADTPINKIDAYLDLMCEEELICARSKIWINGSKTYKIKYLTLKGEKFVNAVKNPNLWKKQKNSIVEKGISFLGDVISKIIFGTI